MEKWYELFFNPAMDDQWNIGDAKAPDGSECDMWAFNTARVYRGQMPVIFSVRVHKKPLKITFGVFQGPVLEADLADELRPLLGSDVQWIPARVEGVDKDYEMMNILNEIDCIDDQQSILELIDYSKPMTDEELEGRTNPRTGERRKYNNILELIVDPLRLIGHNIVRTKQWPVILISEPVAELLVRKVGRQIKLTPVTKPATA